MYNGKKWEYNPLNFKNLWNVFRYFIKEMGLTFAVPERTWYDYFNPEAYGNHIYPSGIHKYYDLYSLDGYWLFFSDYLIAFVIFGANPNVFLALLSFKSDTNRGYLLVDANGSQQL